MGEVSEIELDLGLSIGGSFRKSETTSKPVEGESGLSFDSNTINGFNLDLRETQTTTTTVSRASASPTGVSDAPESTVLDQKTKREIHALRRKEAKKKQQEKRSRSGLKNSSSLLQDHSNDISVEEQRPIKREKTEYGNAGLTNNNNNNDNKNVNLINSSNGPTLPYHTVTAAPSPPPQYPYARLQFVPYTNGFAYPCVMPCWTPAPTSGGNEKNVIQPMPCRGFTPFLTGQRFGLNLPNGFGSEQNGGKGSEVRKTTSNGSPVCSSSTVSDYRSSSQEGDSSSDTRTHSSQSSPEQNPRNDSKANSEVLSACSNHTEPAATQNNNKTNNNNNVSKPKSRAEISSPDHNDSSKETNNMDVGRKPPRPQAQSRNGTPPPIQRMPFVSTRGNGPNGKTVTGFLCRYTESEVSIVCVCHGSTFSPAEFVEHAGGTDVSQPLKHITVIPSAFG